MKKGKLIDNKLYRWFMWGLAALFYAYRYLLDVSPSVMVDDLMRSLSVTAAVLGNIAAFFLYAYSGMQLLVGVLLDRYGARRLLSGAAFTSGVGIFLFANATGVVTGAFGRLLCGLGASFTAVGCMYIASKWLPPNRFALATGLVLTIGMIGAIGGTAPLSMLISSVGWRNALYILSLGGIIMALLLGIFLRDKSKTAVEKIKNPGRHSILDGLKHVITSKQSWLLSIYAGLIFMPITIFGSLWGVPFLVQKFNYTTTAAASLIITLYVGLAIGSPFFGWFSDYVGKRRSIMYISSVGTTLSTALLLYLPHLPQSFAGFFLFAFGFFTGASFVAYAALLENIQSCYAGSALGFMNVLNMIGGAAGMPVVGMILDWQWRGAMLNGVRHYSLVNYEIALAIMPIALALSIFFLPAIKETNCKHL